MNKKGFTLVELLGVIVILGIIITIVATKGFGAFDNAKTKINEENLNTIKEAANLLMTEVKNCDESIDSILIKNFVGIGKNCNDLKEKASTEDTNGECLKITLKYLLENDYVSGSGIESISKEYPDFYVNACINNDKVDTEVIPGEKGDGTTTTTTTTTTATTTTAVAENNACKGITYGKNTLAYAIICNAKSVTNEQKNSGYAEYRETPLTKVAEEISVENESTLSITQDDYGTSYYYRGNVKNNYINFAGMCWRIVRIAGDGSIKMTLAAQKDCGEITSSDTGTAFIGAGNYGFHYTTSIYKMNYLKPVTGNSRSMVKAFYNFQTTNLSGYTDKLKSGDWCLGDTAYTRTGSSKSDYTYTLLSDTSSNYYSNKSFYYDAYVRLTGENKDGYKPTLKCNGTKLYKFATVGGVSQEIPMHVSTLTIDEVAYAGGSWTDSNTNFYLNNNATTGYWWTLSPSYFPSVYDMAFIVNGIGYLGHMYVNNGGNGSLRPAVSLASSAKITSGDGTQTNPYILQ